MCFVGPEEARLDLWAGKIGCFAVSIVYRCINLFKICQILGNPTFLGFLPSCGISFGV